MSTRMLLVQTAREWGKTPSEFAALPYDDQVFMMALTRTEGKMRAWERQVTEDERPKTPRSGKAKRLR